MALRRCMDSTQALLPTCLWAARGSDMCVTTVWEKNKRKKERKEDGKKEREKEREKGRKAERKREKKKRKEKKREKERERERERERESVKYRRNLAREEILHIQATSDVTFNNTFPHIVLKLNNLHAWKKINKVNNKIIPWPCLAWLKSSNPEEFGGLKNESKTPDPLDQNAVFAYERSHIKHLFLRLCFLLIHLDF